MYFINSVLIIDSPGLNPFLNGLILELIVVFEVQIKLTIPNTAAENYKNN